MKRTKRAACTVGIFTHTCNILDFKSVDFLNPWNSGHSHPCSVCVHGSKCKLAVEVFGLDMQSHQLEWAILKIRGGVVIPVLPLPGAEGLTSTVIMKAAHQRRRAGAYKRRSERPGLIILDGRPPRNQTHFRYFKAKDRPSGMLFQLSLVCFRCILINYWFIIVICWVLLIFFGELTC